MIDFLLGMAVLTGPLWLIILLAPIAFFIAVKLSKRFKTTGTRLTAGIGIFLLAFLIPFADEIVGRAYLSHLCSTEAGVKVYKTVELPKEYWDASGEPRFINARGVLDDSVLGQEYEWQSKTTPIHRWPAQIDREQWQLKSVRSKIHLGDRITYVRHYGWIGHFSPSPRVGESCREVWARKYGTEVLFQKENKEQREFMLKVFVPVPS